MKNPLAFSLALACSGFNPALAADAGPERAILKEAVVAAPIEEVWKAWTTSEGIATFFAPEAVVEPRSGGAFFVHMNPYGAPGMRGADDMRVLAVQENKMISFTWNAPPHLPETRAQRTLVIVRLLPVAGNETRVRLTHIGWGDGGQWDQTYAYFDRAWGNVLANLQKRFVEGPMDWKPWLARMKAATEEAQKQKTR
jgi:uncharacterized protein YndB with AHSA1/START domain